AAFMVRLIAGVVAVESPVQCEKRQPGAAVAVSVATVPVATSALQVSGQSMPLPATEPSPSTATDSVKVASETVKLRSTGVAGRYCSLPAWLAVTVQSPRAPLRVTVVPVTEHTPVAAKLTVRPELALAATSKVRTSLR